MIPISLPSEERRAAVRSFWVLISAGVGAGLWLVGWVSNGIPRAVPLIAAVACWLLVVARPTVVRRLYRAWNRILVRPFAHLAARVTLRICFVIVCAAADRSQKQRWISGQAGGGWWPRSSLPSDAYALSFAMQGGPPAGRGWIRSYVNWAVASGNYWSIALVPFLAFLELFSSGQPQSVQANVYTLF